MVFPRSQKWSHELLSSNLMYSSAHETPLNKWLQWSSATDDPANFWYKRESTEFCHEKLLSEYLRWWDLRVYIDEAQLLDVFFSSVNWELWRRPSNRNMSVKSHGSPIHHNECSMSREVLKPREAQSVGLSFSDVNFQRACEVTSWIADTWLSTNSFHLIGLFLTLARVTEESVQRETGTSLRLSMFWTCLTRFARRAAADNSNLGTARRLRGHFSFWADYEIDCCCHCLLRCVWEPMILYWIGLRVQM